MTLEGVGKQLGALALSAVAVGCAEPGGSRRDHRGPEQPAQIELATTTATNLVWGGQQRLVASDAAELDQLGYAVSLDADRALLGAYGDDFYRGAVYVLARNSGSWTQEQKLVANDGVEGDDFGWSVSLGGDRALVGAFARDGFRGAAYVFVRSGDSWTQEQQLVASDGAEGDNFGWSVSLSGDRALVSAFARDSARGTAYVFVLNDGSWTEEKKLEASDGIANDQLGYSLSLAGNRALLGAPGRGASRGAAYVFVESDGSWTEEKKLEASDGVESDNFGQSVSLAADRALVGAYWNESLRGAAYVFARDGSSWSEEKKLLASDGDNGDRFGGSTSLGADRALIGAYGNNDVGGAAYVFTLEGGSWSEQQRLAVDTGAGADLFGWSVSLGAERVLIGAPFDDNLRGAAYVFSLGLANGALCSANADCASGYCVDDLCCDVDCTGACAACSVAEGAAADGTCVVFPAGSEGVPSCGSLGCNGQSAQCAPCESDEDCPGERHCAADQTCQPRKEQGESCDDRAGADCLNQGCRSCQSGVCADGVCCDRECTAAEACTSGLKISGADGTCGEAKAAVNGSFCATGEACTSGHCVDGVCCDRACDGTCEACTAILKGEGEDGTCGFVAEGQNPARSASHPALDCAPDAWCAAGGQCVSTPGDGGPDEGAGCGCRTGGKPEHAAGSWLGAAFALLLLLRRKAPASTHDRTAGGVSRAPSSPC